MKNRKRGISLIELMLVIAIIGSIMAGVVAYFSKNVPLYQRTRGRQELLLEARVCMDTIVGRLRNGKAKSLKITTPAPTSTSPLVPFSKIQFDVQTALPSGATFYSIYLQDGIVYSKEGTMDPQPLAHNVTGLIFGASTNDPAFVGVTLRMDAPYDKSGDPTHASIILLPNEVVHMVESP